MLLDSFPLFVSLLPLATYLLLLGGIRICQRPLITTQARDGAALAIALVGLVMIGPVHLFFPSAAAAELGWMVWLVLAVFYALCVSLLLMSIKPKIIAYGLPSRQLLDMVLQAALAVDDQATASQDRLQVTLPVRGVHLRIESQGFTDVLQVEAFERNLHPQFWQHLLLNLRQHSQTIRTPISYSGWMMFLTGILLLMLCLMQVVNEPAEMIAGFRQWMRL